MITGYFGCQINLQKMRAMILCRYFIGKLPVICRCIFGMNFLVIKNEMYRFKNISHRGVPERYISLVRHGIVERGCHGKVHDIHVVDEIPGTSLVVRYRDLNRVFLSREKCSHVHRVSATRTKLESLPLHAIDGENCLASHRA